MLAMAGDVTDRAAFADQALTRQLLPRRPRQKPRTGQPLAFCIVIDLVQHIGWKRDVDAHCLGGQSRRIDQDCHSVAVFSL